MSRTAPEGGTGSALDAVIASEKRAELWQSLKLLPKRQRRVFLLYTLDGWSCAEIAQAEGISAHAVHHLLSRARIKMRSLSENRPLPAIVLPFSWLRWKFQRIEERIRPLLSLRTDGLPAACLQLACLGALAIVGATSNPVNLSNAGEAVSSEETAVLAMQSRPLQDNAMVQNALPSNGVPAKKPGGSQEPIAGPADSLIDDVMNRQNATPEQTFFYSIVVSSGYESDHTVLAGGYSGLGRWVLFISRDGGASWKPLPSILLSGAHIALSPRYSQDRRVFALGDLGLQQSDDGGEIFKVASPLSGNSIVSPVSGNSLAISPSFGNGESKVLIAGGNSVFEYDVGTGVTRPASLGLPVAPEWWAYRSVAFSPDYQSDRTIFVSRYSANENEAFLYRCEVLVCDEMQFPFPGPLILRLSPRFNQDGLAYAFTSRKFLVSHDRARTFQEIPVSAKYIQDPTVLWKTSSDPAIFFSTNASLISSSSISLLSMVSRSLDGGYSWDRSRSQIDIIGFGLGDSTMIVTPTGRLIMSGGMNGIACSEDGGQTWAPRCTPEP